MATFKAGDRVMLEPATVRTVHPDGTMFVEWSPRPQGCSVWLGTMLVHPEQCVPVYEPATPSILSDAPGETMANEPSLLRRGDVVEDAQGVRWRVGKVYGDTADLYRDEITPPPYTERPLELKAAEVVRHTLIHVPRVVMKRVADCDEVLRHPAAGN